MPDSRHADRFFDQWQGTFEWVRPRVGCIGFPRLFANTSIDTVAENLVENEGVMLLPGIAYGHPENHFRLGLGRRDFPEALEALGHYAETTLR